MCSMKLSPWARGSEQLTLEHSEGEGQPRSSCCWFWHWLLSLLSQPSLPEANQQTGLYWRWSSLGYWRWSSPEPRTPKAVSCPCGDYPGKHCIAGICPPLWKWQTFLLEPPCLPAVFQGDRRVWKYSGDCEGYPGMTCYHHHRHLPHY